MCVGCSPIPQDDALSSTYHSKLTNKVTEDLSGTDMMPIEERLARIQLKSLRPPPTPPSPYRYVMATSINPFVILQVCLCHRHQQARHSCPSPPTSTPVLSLSINPSITLRVGHCYLHQTLHHPCKHLLEFNACDALSKPACVCARVFACVRACLCVCTWHGFTVCLRYGHSKTHAHVVRVNGCCP